MTILLSTEAPCHPTGRTMKTIYKAMGPFILLNLIRVMCFTDPKCRLKSVSDLEGVTLPGDIILGVVVPIHIDKIFQKVTFQERPPTTTCTLFNLISYQHFQAMVFAVDEINKDPRILPNVTLGFQAYDSCDVLQMDLSGSLQVLTGYDVAIPNYRCLPDVPLSAVIGAAVSTHSILLANILGLYRYPQISHLSTSPLLSDHNKFPSFFRTVPSDAFQSLGLAKLVLHFGWTWVGLLAMDNDYGQQGIQLVRKEIIKGGACVAFTESILLNKADCNAPQIVRVIKRSTAKVVVTFSYDIHLVPVLDEMLRQNVTDKVLVASEAWSTSKVQLMEKFSKLLKGTIGLALYSGTIPGFRNFLNTVHPSMPFGGKWARLFWEEVFGCQYRKERNSTELVDTIEKECTGQENLNSIQTTFSDVSSLRITYNVYTAVHVVAQALEDLDICHHSQELSLHSQCVNIYNFKPWQQRQTLLHNFSDDASSILGSWIKNRITKMSAVSVLHKEIRSAEINVIRWRLRSHRQQVKGCHDRVVNGFSVESPFMSLPSSDNTAAAPGHEDKAKLLRYMKTVRVKLSNGRELYFDENGDPPALYDIVNWQLTPEDSIRYVTVGNYDTSAPPDQVFTINSSMLQWATKESEHQVPTSVCSESCPPGFWKAAKMGEPGCCFECIPCPLGEIANSTDTTNCIRCPWDQWPNVQKSNCLPKALEYLSYDESLGTTLAVITSISSLAPHYILRLFAKHKSSPVVKASNYSVSCLLLVSLSSCFLCSFVFIGYPQPTSCLLRQAIFGLVFALCVSCILAKTLMVVFAFMATKPSSRVRKLITPRVSYTIICIGFTLQLILCTTWLSVTPPFPQYNTQTKPEVIIVECNEGSSAAFWIMLGYLFLLASISFIVAFLARRLPDRFNEAQFITFSMLAFLSVWISYIPASLSAHGKYIVAMEIFAILASSWALVFCMFIPKCFIILFKPRLNTKENVMRK
ncbi:extracellular calcium-sensing receptor-like [Gastrophryne carolinensis]